MSVQVKLLCKLWKMTFLLLTQTFFELEHWNYWHTHNTPQSDTVDLPPLLRTGSGFVGG